jgi:mannose-6-phosphate isomerase-like protein (cupin superfamily)
VDRTGVLISRGGPGEGVRAYEEMTMTTLLNDLRYSARTMPRRSSGLTAAVFAAVALCFCGASAPAQVDPTWLHSYAPEVRERGVAWSTSNCHYQPMFGERALALRKGVMRTVVRFGEVKIDPQGACSPVMYEREEEIYVILEGNGILQYGEEKVPVRRNDFMYLPPGISHTITASTDRPCRLVIMGFRIPQGITLDEPPPKLVVANMDDVKEQTVEGHPSSVLYKLLVGDRKSKRDRIAAGYVVTSLFLMDFAPGGTNTPHHHETAEEIYLILDGHGKIVAGGGEDGVEGLHEAHAGDAYFFRLNCTVGFYNSSEPGAKAHILAVRSRFPFHAEED